MVEKYINANKILETKKMILNAYPKIKWLDDMSFTYDNEYRNINEVKTNKIKYNCIDKTKAVISDNTNEKSDDKSQGVLSPDGKFSVYFANHNLVMRNVNSNEIKNLTTDGIENFDYGTSSGCNNSTIKSIVENNTVKPCIVWSKDSKKILTYKLDQRDVEELHIVQNVVDNDEHHRPKHFAYKYHLPNDENIPLAYLCVYDVEKDALTMLDAEPLYLNFGTPFDEHSKKVKWLDDSVNIYYVRLNRFFNEAKLNIINTETNICRTIVNEKSNTFLDIDSYGETDGGNDFNFSVYVSENLDYAIWKSDKDGRAKFYYYDLTNEKNNITLTSNDYIARNIVAVDEKSKVLYFTANDFSDSSDPYFLYFCSVNLDGTNFKKLVNEDADHSVTISPEYSFFVDTYSRVDLPPVTNLRDKNGEFIAEIEKADITQLLENGFIFPERFSIKASDGKTDLYGIIIKPADFDETKKYPIIDYIYGGVQCTNVPKNFAWCNEGKGICGGLESFAQLGFVGIVLDGPGTTNRGKDFHDIAYKNLQGCAGLDEHLYCTKKLAEKYKYLDIEKVGIWGASGGGYATLRAMCLYPDFYKVGASFSGNHDERLYNACWVERYNGEYEKSVYDEQDNAELVENLQGKLLIAHGDLDDNVHISNSMRVIDQLIKHNKDFEMLIVPNEFHNLSAHSDYAIRKRWDHFVKYLLNVQPPKEYKIVHEFN
ncbi:MAG: DPP IV N-terminal domain-containing protein [Oscillospiraceae bacterium]